MPTKKLCATTLAVSLAAAGGILLLLWCFGNGTPQLALGFAVGAAVCCITQILLFAAWRAAPQRSKVAVLYGLRAVLLFGSILAAMFVPWVDALGVVVPQLFPVPVLAVAMVLDSRKGHGGEK